jgi:tetratricopeptide (TPR) repeat protein
LPVGPQISPIAAPVSPASAEELAEWTTQAEALMRIEQFGKSLVLWDRVIRHDPDDHHAYFNRALSYLELTWNQRSLEEYREYNCRALQDSNLAIDLADRPIGDYYYTRFRAYDNLAKTVEYRVDQEQLSEIALENMLIAWTCPSLSLGADGASLYAGPAGQV